MSLESILLVGRKGAFRTRGGEDAQALFGRPARAGVAGWGSRSAAGSHRSALWRRSLDGVPLAPAGTRRGPTLYQAARRRSHAGDRCGGRGDLAGAGEGAERSYAGRIQRAVGGAHRAAASKPADAVPRPAAVWVVA